MEDKTLKKYTLYRLRTKIIEKKYEQNIKVTNDIVGLLENYIQNLKNINILYTRADIESLKYGVTSYPDSLFRNEQIYRHKFFSIILGLVDGWYIKLKELNADNIYDSNINLLTSLRNKVLEDYKNTSLSCDLKIIKDFIEKIPCYINFNMNISTIRNESDTKLYLEFIESYIKGINNYPSFELYEIYNVYTNLMFNLEEYKRNNKNKVYKLKKDNSNEKD